MLKGYRTLIAMGVGVLFAVAPFFGIDLAGIEATAIVNGILFLGAFGLRFVTDTKVGKGS